MKRLLRLHPFLFALFPVINLYSNNTELVALSEIVRALLVVLAGALIIHFILTLIVRDASKAGLILSAFLIMFFAYGHIHSLLPDFRFHLGGYILYPNTVLLPLWALVLLVIALFIAMTKRNLARLTSLFNVAGGLLVVVSFVFIAAAIVAGAFETADTDRSAVVAEPPEYRPDIYYIILDGYARADLLQSRFGFDNGPFLDSLAARGFFVAESSYSNYCQTLLSLSSSLNLTYHDKLVQELGEESSDRKRLIRMIRNNYVSTFLKSYGYQAVAFSSGYYGTEITNADIYLSEPGALSEFEEILLNTTPIPVVIRRMKAVTLHRDRILHNLANLSVRPDTESPIFAFAHFICPHPPFVFDRNGARAGAANFQVFAQGKNGVWPSGQTYEQAYIEQIRFVNARLLEAIDAIVESSPSTIIVLQGDHGALFPRTETESDSAEYRQKFSILNAYRLPDADSSVLYGGISPVNSFAVIINQTFGKDFEILDDRSYWSTWAEPFRQREVTGMLRGN